MKKKKHAEEHENSERWVVSYADFMTLLFALFTAMYAISNVDAKKAGRLVLAMRAAFDPTGFASAQSSRVSIVSEAGAAALKATFIENFVDKAKPTPQKSGDGGNQPGGGERAGGGAGGGDGARLQKIKEDISNLILDEALRDKVQIVIKARGVVISLAEAGFFDSGRHAVRSESLPLLDKISSYLRRLPNHIRITGHSDDRRIRTTRFPSNWELSTARAAHIVSYLVDKHSFDPKKLSAAGYGEHRPAASNDTAEGRARNRRVDLIIPALSVNNPDPDSVD